MFNSGVFPVRDLRLTVREFVMPVHAVCGGTCVVFDKISKHNILTCPLNNLNEIHCIC